MAKKKGIMILLCLVGLLLLGMLSALRKQLNPEEKREQDGTYGALPADASAEDPLEHLNENFLVDAGYSSHLPIVILEIDGELGEYKSFSGGKEIVDESAEPYTSGRISVIEGGDPDNHLKDAADISSAIQIKKRGHTSFSFDKPQYLVKTVDGALENPVDMLGMGEGDSWILNGSMADKSMLRNYLSYRIASEIGGGAMAPDCRYCEVLLAAEEGYEYQGVYLLQETVSRGENRVNIDQYKQKNSYTSYIVRRDRYTNFDVMLDTYGRLSGLSEEWIGLKYPSGERLTEKAKQFIESDFSVLEQMLYSEDVDDFKVYDKYIDMDSFVDYFLINEFFGNYDAGEHSTYMYKNSGGKLYIGPVWDFDQAMNNYYQDEMDPYTLAFQTKPFFEQLCRDERFIDCLKDRYSELRKGALAEEHVLEVMDEITEYLSSARVREWYRWAADYEDDSFTNIHNYYLQDYERDGVMVNRFSEDYEQELYNIRTYLHKHGNVIQTELTKLYDLAECNTSLKNENELLLLIVMILFLVPSLLINRKD